MILYMYMVLYIKSSIDPYMDFYMYCILQEKEYDFNNIGSNYVFTI